MIVMSHSAPIAAPQSLIRPAWPTSCAEPWLTTSPQSAIARFRCDRGVLCEAGLCDELEGSRLDDPAARRFAARILPYPDLDPATSSFGCCLRLDDLDAMVALVNAAGAEEKHRLAALQSSATGGERPEDRLPDRSRLHAGAADPEPRLTACPRKSRFAGSAHPRRSMRPSRRGRTMPGWCSIQRRPVRLRRMSRAL